MAWSEIQWGTVGEWVSGVGGLVAAGTAVWVVLSDRSRQKEQAEARSRQQILDVGVTKADAWHRDTKDGHAIVYIVANKGGWPLYDLDLIVVWTEGAQAHRKRLTSVAAGSAEEVQVLLKGRLPGAEHKVILEATDADGRRWRRDLESNRVERIGAS